MGKQLFVVTVLTGFLGSGKTTMLNDILSSKEHKLRIAIIENEAGAISIDHELLKHVDKERGVYVMENGCMCCSAGGDGDELERILTKIIAIMDDESYDYLVIETSGLVDPTSILQTFFSEEMASGRYFLDAVVTLVDVKNITKHLKGEKFGTHSPEAERQISLADIIVLNKIDLVSANELENVENQVKILNPVCSIIKSQFSKVDPSKVLNIGAFNKDKILERLPEVSSQSPAHGKHILSISITHDEPITLESFQSWSKTILDKYYTDIYRIKGILNVVDTEKRYIIQGVSTEVHGEVSRLWKAGEERKTTIILIGKKLNPDLIRQSFKNICSVSNNGGAYLVNDCHHNHQEGEECSEVTKSVYSVQSEGSIKSRLRSKKIQ